MARRPTPADCFGDRCVSKAASNRERRPAADRRPQPIAPCSGLFADLGTRDFEGPTPGRSQQNVPAERSVPVVRRSGGIREASADTPGGSLLFGRRFSSCSPRNWHAPLRPQ